MLKKKKLLLLVMAVFGLTIIPNVSAASIEVDTLDKLQYALNNSDYDEIVLTQVIEIEENTTLDGENKLVRATGQGVDDQGIIKSASEYSLFAIKSSGKLKISNMKIKGSSIHPFDVEMNGKLELENVSISNSGNEYYEAGAICNNGTIYLKNVILRHNVARFAGAILNRGKMIIDGAVIYENRNIGDGAFGGGAIENQGEAYINNAILANNYSTEIGGAINNFGGTLYIANSTITGNITESDTNYFGGGIGNNHGDVTIVNSVLNNNYYLNNDFFTPDDFGMYDGSDVKFINSIVGNVFYRDNSLIETNINVKNVSDNIFDRITPGHIVTKENKIVSYDDYLKPNIVVNDYTGNIYSKIDGEAFTGGAYTFFDYDTDTSNVSVCYGATTDAAQATCLVGDASQNNLVTKFADGSTRDVLVIGSSGPSNANYYTLIVDKAEHGHVLNGSLFGTSYIQNAIVNLVPVADSGYYLKSWEYKYEDEWYPYSEITFLKVKMDKDIILKPIFETATEHQITFDSSIENDITTQTNSYIAGSVVQLEYTNKYIVTILKTSNNVDITSLVSYDDTSKTFIMPGYDVKITATKVPDNDPAETPENNPPNAPENDPNETTGDVTNETPEEKPIDVPENKPIDVPENKPIDVPENKPSEKPENKPIDAPGNDSNETTDNIPAKAPEDVPKTLDNISYYIVLCFISLIGFISTGLYLLKNKN